MTKNIFNSIFKLNYTNYNVEENYRQLRNEKILYYYDIQAMILLVGGILASIINSFFIDFMELNIFKIIFYSSHVMNLYFMFNVLIAYLSTNTKLKIWLNYLNYFLFLFLFFNIRFPLVNIVSTNFALSFFLMSVEAFLRIIWIVVGTICFTEFFILSSMTLVVGWIIYVPNLGMFFNNEIYNFVVYSTLLISLIGLSYILEKQQKTAFYLHWKAKKKTACLCNLYDNINTGFISIKGTEVQHINSFLINLFSSIKTFIFDKTERINEVKENLIILELSERDNLEENKILNSNIKNPEFILNFIFSNLRLDAKDLIKNIKLGPNSKRIPYTKNHLNIFKSAIKQINGIDNFTYIGDIYLQADDIENNFEIFCRYNEFKSKEAELEFLFNEVTRTKLKEKQKAEFNYKTLFLSKVAHEFKNPLICITELINEIHSSKAYTGNKEELELIDKLDQIKSMSDFLLILVRDLNYLSQIEMGKSLPFENEEFELTNVLNFSKEITKSLLKKSNKENVIDFKISVEKNVPIKIHTDEWRLKQVLVNLISNAVKFTFNGEIRLEVSKETLDFKDYLKFLVRDTGLGIKDELKKNLFQPFTKDTSKINKSGSGLGLSIATDIASKLGDKISFTSELGKGSSFWFYVKLPPKEETNSICSDEIIYKLNKDENKNNILNLMPNEHSEIFDESNITMKEHLGGSNDEIKKSFSESHKEINLKNTKLFEQENLFISESEILNFYFKFKINFASDKDLYYLKRKDAINIIVTDDEFLTRQSTMRSIQSIASEYKIKINIIECEDGIESAYIVYKCLILGIKITIIFSDECMNFINGYRSSEIINEIFYSKSIPKIPFYLVTGFEKEIIESITSKYVDKVLEKPLKKEIAKKIIFEII